MLEATQAENGRHGTGTLATYGAIGVRRASAVGMTEYDYGSLVVLLDQLCNTGDRPEGYRQDPE